MENSASRKSKRSQPCCAAKADDGSPVSSLLPYDPVPWLMVQNGLAAVRARRFRGLHRDDDEETVKSIELEFCKSQLPNGSFDQSLLKTAGVLNLLADLKPFSSKTVIQKAASYLLSILEAQPGYDRAKSVKPSSLETPCDLCGFFGSYEDRNFPEVLALGAKEMNFYREFEPLLGPKSAVRAVRRSSLDRPGPSSCYSWGLIPLCYTIEALCRSGYAEDPKLKPAINVLLGAQRKSGGWCRNLAGHPNCTIQAIRALASHRQLKQGAHAEKALGFMHMTRFSSGDSRNRWWRGSNVFAAVQAIAAWDTSLAREIILSVLSDLAKRQQKNGTWGGLCKIERVAAVLYAARRIA